MRQSGLTYTNNSGQAFSTYPLAPDFQGCDHHDPDHSYNGGRIELNNGACDGWLRPGANDIFAIGYYQEPDLPFYSAAANLSFTHRSASARTIPKGLQHSAQGCESASYLGLIDGISLRFSRVLSKVVGSHEDFESAILLILSNFFGFICSMLHCLLMLFEQQ
jgi:hypothetical protein